MKGVRAQSNKSGTMITPGDDLRRRRSPESNPQENTYTGREVHLGCLPT